MKRFLEILVLRFALSAPAFSAVIRPEVMLAS